MDAPLSPLGTVPLMEKLIAFDIETTGLYPEQGDRILEIGAVPLIGNQVLLENGFEALINPGMHIPPEISRINGITDDMVRDAPSLESVLPKFLDFIGPSGRKCLNFIIIDVVGVNFMAVFRANSRLNKSDISGSCNDNFHKFPLIWLI